MYNIKYQINGVKYTFKSENLISGIVKKSDGYHYPLNGSQNQVFEKLLLLLKRWIKLAKHFDINWWACAGTLLGAMRNNSFIPWDNDIDVAIFYKDYMKILKVIKSGILDNTDIIIEKVCIGFRISLKNHQTPYIDVFVNDYSGDRIKPCGPIMNLMKYWVVGTLVFPKEAINKNDLLPIKETTFGGLTIRIPNNSIKYLQQVYGNNCITYSVLQKENILHECSLLLKLDRFMLKMSEELIDNELKDHIVLDFITDKLEKINSAKLIEFF